MLVYSLRATVPDLSLVSRVAGGGCDGGWGGVDPWHPAEAWAPTLLPLPSLRPRQDLEQKLTLQEQDAVLVRTMKSELARLPKVERELKRLRDENTHLR